MVYTTQQIRNMVVAEANRQGVDPALALAVAANESSFRPDVTSNKGAQGVFQLMPDTADWLGVSDPYDPQQNIEGGVRYIGMMLNQFGDPQTAIAAYNFGPGAVGRGETWPSETNVYVSRVMNSWNQYGGQFATPYPTIDPPPLLSDATWSVTGYGVADAGAGSGIGSSGTLLLILLAVAAVAITKY